ncbi:hypothetical protein AVEN_159101-1 [Araneus ventricosus]|uniref:Uncharacterized protein n=1 Tax=Araneus ventricosus TaxID=182803 RepID=A0A4Y2BB56_ARAVE|nr:hypothetical protein AVEN_159101-1 [Araneus ventricosus]
MTRTAPEPAIPVRAAPEGGYLAPTDGQCTRLAYMAAVLLWNRISNLESSAPEVEALPPGHHIMNMSKEIKMFSTREGERSLHSLEEARRAS